MLENDVGKDPWMEVTQALFLQICVMFALMIIGALLFRAGLIREQTSKDLGSILLHVVVPVVIIRSFWGKYSSERLVALGVTFVLSLAVLALAIVISRLCFPHDAVAEFSAEFSNCGYIGIPLIESALGEDAVFFIACLIAELNILQWTYGKWRLSGSTDSISPKAIVTNPVIIALVVGIALFLLRMPVPEFAENLMSSIAGLNSPLSMMILGVYLAQSNARELFATPRLYKVSAVRLLLVPAATIALLAIVPCDTTIKLAIIIAAAAPAGANVVVFCQQLDGDAKGATGMVCLSTLLSLASIPLITAVATMVL